MYKVNLLPPKLQREGNVDVRRLLIIAAITLLIAGALGGYGGFLLSFMGARNDLTYTQQRLDSMAPVVARVEETRTQRKDMEAAVKEYSSVLQNRMNWYDLLSDFSHITPIDLWLVDLEIGYQDPNQAAAPSSPDDKSKTATSAKAPATTGGQSNSAKTTTGGQTASPGNLNQEGQMRPNTVSLKGFSRSVASVGMFASNLHGFPRFQDIWIDMINAQEDGYEFQITLGIKGES